MEAGHFRFFRCVPEADFLLLGAWKRSGECNFDGESARLATVLALGES
jgi:hypothetical protein